ncbi:hypothetical protein VSK92_05840 [Bacillus swezeyi]|uniref:hypothetical protein n=1 Tax=Bacillus swezeyi TaxID=1925020 RepID=UPI0039C607DC
MVKDKGSGNVRASQERAPFKPANPAASETASVKVHLHEKQYDCLTIPLAEPISAGTPNC